MGRKPVSKLYDAWHHIKQRCFNTKCKDYPNYGGRGITLYEPWNEFANFFADFKNRFGLEEIPAGKSIDRIDNDKGYFPDNIQLATRVEQANNTRNNIVIEFNGKKQSLTQHCQELGMNMSTIWYRVSRGWSFEKALSTPIRNQKNTSGYVGVCRNKKTGKWIAFANVDKKRVMLGSFSDKAKAIAARRSAELR